MWRAERDGRDVVRRVRARGWLLENWRLDNGMETMLYWFAVAKEITTMGKRILGLAIMSIAAGVFCWMAEGAEFHAGALVLGIAATILKHERGEKERLRERGERELEALGLIRRMKTGA